MFGISFSELLLIAAVAVVVVGPQKLPQMLGTVGRYIGKIRRIATDMRRQTGIDEILRAEGLHGGLNELRGMMRGDLRSVGHGAGQAPPRPPMADPYDDYVEYDRTREYPVEGPDAFGAIPEDLAGDVDETNPPGPAAVPEDSPGTAASSDVSAGATPPETKASA